MKKITLMDVIEGRQFYHDIYKKYVQILDLRQQTELFMYMKETHLNPMAKSPHHTQLILAYTMSVTLEKLAKETISPAEKKETKELLDQLQERYHKAHLDID